MVQTIGDRTEYTALSGELVQGTVLDEVEHTTSYPGEGTFKRKIQLIKWDEGETGVRFTYWVKPEGKNHWIYGQRPLSCDKRIAKQLVKKAMKKGIL